MDVQLFPPSALVSTEKPSSLVELSVQVNVTLLGRMALTVKPVAGAGAWAKVTGLDLASPS